MNRLSPGTSDNSRINEATPLLHDDEIVIDDELYALGGAVGGLPEGIDGASGYADEDVYEAQADIDNMVQAIYGLTAATSAIDDSTEEIGDASGCADEDVYAAQAFIENLVKAIYSSPAATSDATDDSTEGIDDTSGCAVEDVYAAQAFIENLVKAIYSSTAATSDATEGIDDTSECVDESVTEEQSDNDKIVKALFLAWLQFPPRRLGDNEGEESQILSPKALNAMSTVWRQIKAGRDVLPEPEIIVQGLTETMRDYIFPQATIPEGAKDFYKNILTIYIFKKVSDGWQQILDGIEKDAKERARKRREKRKRIRERMRRRREIGEVLRFYEPFARIDYSAPVSCGHFCLVLCQFCSIVIFQVPIHTLLLCWPISILVMGALYMTQCPMSHHMPYVMMALGIVGTVALLMRLSFAIYQHLTETLIRSMWPWVVLKVIEFAFLDFLIMQLFYFFSETPSFDPGSPKYCNETFYSFVHWINYVSIALVSAWMLVYFTKGLLWLRSRKFRFGYR